MDIWQETFPPRFGAVDRSDRLTLSAAFEFFQEVAINHAEDLGVGRDAMASTGRAWVLSRMSVLMERRLRWREPFTVRSWPRGWEKLFAIRDYDILDGEGRPVVRGRSGWLVLDREKRRPLRPQTVMEGLPLNEGLDALSEAAALEVRGDLEKAGERRAAYSDIDFNGHVNNARYIQWLQDACDPAVFEGADRIRLDVNYLAEVRYGELTELWSAPLVLPAARRGGPPVFDRGAAFEGRRRDGTAAFRAELRTGGGGAEDGGGAGTGGAGGGGGGAPGEAGR
jgi:acyl-ACP thioesterase